MIAAYAIGIVSVAAYAVYLALERRRLRALLDASEADSTSA